MSATTILYGKNLSNFFGNGCVSVVGSLVFLWGGGRMGGRGSLNSLPYVDLSLQGVVWVVLKAGN